MLQAPTSSGHSQKEWIRVFDKYVNFNEITNSDYVKCDPDQLRFIQEIKRFHARQKRIYAPLPPETKYTRTTDID